MASGFLSSPSPPAVQTAGRGRAETALAAIEFNAKNVGIPSIVHHLRGHVGLRQHLLPCARHEWKFADNSLAAAGGRLHIHPVTRVACLRGQSGDGNVGLQCR